MTAPACHRPTRDPAGYRQTPDCRDDQQRLTRVIWLLYLLAVVYGSLIPLDFVPMALDQAWEHLLGLRLHAFTVDTRTDWMVNTALGVPTGFLTAIVISGALPRLPRGLVVLLASLFAIAFVASVEFSQIFFPDRTASLDDITAQSLGGVLGAVLAAGFPGRSITLHCALRDDPRQRMRRLLETYFVAYLVFSLFPYDILLSLSELQQKMRGASAGWLLAGGGHPTAGTAVRLVAEIVAAMPFGIFLGLRPGFRAVTWRQAVALGLLLGVALELAQLCTATGVSQGLSVLTRTFGVCAGFALWRHRDARVIERLRGLLSRYALLLGGFYLGTLLLVNGSAYNWQGADVALIRLGEVHFLPFYYHYYVPEARALVSISAVCLTYLPIGLLVWSAGRSPRLALLLALVTATLCESAKLFIDGMRPDPSNIWLGALSAWGGVHLARALAASLATPDISMSEPSGSLPRYASQSAGPRFGGKWLVERRRAMFLSLPALLFSAYQAATFPAYPAWLCALLVCCAAIVWFHPVTLVAVVAAVLPILDLAHWSGRFFFDEFDLLLIVVMAIGYARLSPVVPGRRQPHAIGAFAFTLLFTSFAISAVRGLTPWPTIDDNAFNNYLSAFNGLRIAKGVIWAVLMHGLLRRLFAAGSDVNKSFAWGMVVGLASTVAVVLWERIAFSGPFNFASDYRVTGPFSAMHTGGAYIECFLASAVPFVVALIAQYRSKGVKLLGTLLLLATTYALMVTFSRNGYLAYGIALALVLFFAMFRSAAGWRHGIFSLFVGVALLAVALPVFTGQFAQSRLATLAGDFAIRRAHWIDALAMRTPDIETTVFGMGLGTFPRSYHLLGRPGSRAVSYRIIDENANRSLRLVPGNPIYMGQQLSLDRAQGYLLQLDVRADKPKGSLDVSICEKWLLSSYNCIWNTLGVGESVGVWRHFAKRIDASGFGNAPWYSRRPLKLALSIGMSGAVVDVDNVSLETTSDEEKIHNGDFSAGLDHWFFTTDSHLPWHIHSLPASVLFDQGWFGVFALALFTLCAVVSAAQRAWRGDLYAAAALAAFVAFLVVGVFDTLIDAPRFLLLLLLLGGYCAFGYAVPREVR